MQQSGAILSASAVRCEQSGRPKIIHLNQFHSLLVLKLSRDLPLVSDQIANPAEPSRAGMLWIPGGTFPMGSDRRHPEEEPAHRARVYGF
jgi:formylglycine-generating enzyme required for sulfatase activity